MCLMSVLIYPVLPTLLVTSCSHLWSHVYSPVYSDEYILKSRSRGPPIRYLVDAIAHTVRRTAYVPGKVWRRGHRVLITLIDH